jgi:phage terminase large subunit-like protein
MDQSVADTEAYCLANDYEQATSRVFDDMLYDAKETSGNWPEGKLSAKPRKDYIPYKDGRYMQALASEYKSVAGARQAMTLWDELWAYTSDASRRLWVEMTPIKIPGVPISLRFISTYAGFEGESELLWDLYTAIVLEGTPVPGLTHIKHPGSGEPTCYKKGRMFAYWDSAHRMPWQDEAYYSEQLDSGMKPNEFARLHENSWVSGSDPFMPIAWWDTQAVLDGDLIYDVKNPRRNLPVVIACDASTKHDSTAVVGVQYDYDNDVVAVAFHGIWTPTPNEPMDFERTLERFILDRYNEGFQISSVVYDPMQLHRSMTRLGTIIGVDKVREFPQSLKNMTAASETLYNVFKNHKILVYPDDDLRAHMQYAMAEDKGKGFRIVKPKKAAHHHTDAAVALAMATYEAFKTHGYDTSQGIKIEVPFADGSQYGADSQKEALEQTMVPPQLRSGGMTEEEQRILWEKHVRSH